MQRVNNGKLEAAIKKITWTEAVVNYEPAQLDNDGLPSLDFKATTENVSKEHYCYPSDTVDYEAIVRAKDNASDINVETFTVEQPIDEITMLGQYITELELSDIEMGQQFTELEFESPLR